MDAPVPSPTRPVALWWWALFAVSAVALLIASYFQKIETAPIEAFGVITGALGVWLEVKENVWNWPIGNISCAIYLWIYFKAQIYATSAIQIVYLVIGFWGWYMWLRGGRSHSVLRVTRTPVREWPILALVTGLGTWVLFLVLKANKDPQPLIDAFASMLAVVAEYQLARKYIENWWIWFVADGIWVALNIVAGLYLTAVLYAAFCAMCFAGYRDWRASQSVPLPGECG